MKDDDPSSSAVRLDHAKITIDGADKPLSNKQAAALVRQIMDHLAPPLRLLLELVWSDPELWGLVVANTAADGRRLPANPSDAMDKLGAWARIEDKLDRPYHYRYRKIVQAQALGLLRSLAKQERMLHGILVMLPASEDQVMKRFADNPVWARNLYRAIATFEEQHRELPTDIHSLIDEVPVPDVRIAYQFADLQIARVDHEAVEYRVRLKHPDGFWLTLAKALPEYAPEGRYTAPLVWVDGLGKLRVRVVCASDVPAPRRRKRELLHVDWNVTGALATVTSSERSRSGVVAGAQYYEYRPESLLVKRERLHVEQNRLREKIDRVDALRKGLSEGHLTRVRLDAKHELLTRERVMVNKSRRDLADRIACDFAREMLVIARALDTDTIVVEDLASLEARKGKLSRGNRTKVAQSPRGIMYDRLSRSTRRDGLRFARVNPRGTSQACPHCGKRVNHPTYRESACANCELIADRDDWASLNVGLVYLKTRSIARRRSRLTKREIALHSTWRSSTRACVAGSLSPVHWRVVSLGDEAQERRKPGHPRKNRIRSRDRDRGSPAALNKP